MAHWYEIMDQATANLVGDFTNEAEALHFIARYIEAQGLAVVRDWALARDGARDEDFLLIAEGDALFDLAVRSRAGAV